MKTKKLFSFLTVGVLSLSLAACGNAKDDTKKEVKKATVVSLKDQFIDSQKKLASANSFSSVSSVKIALDTSKAPSLAKDEESIKLVENASLTFIGNVDKKAGKSEFVLKGKFTGYSVEFPVLVDEKANKAYVKLDGLFEVFPTIRAQFGNELSGKVIEIDVDYINQQLPEGKKIDLKSAEGNKELEKALTKEINSFLEKKSNNEFTKKDGGIKVSYTKDELQKVVNNVVDLSVKYAPDANSKKSLEDSKAELQRSFDELDKNVIVKEISETLKTAKNGIPESDKIVVNLEVKNPDNNEVVGVKVTVDTSYENVNGNVSFTIDPSKDSIVTTEELMKLYMSSVQNVEAGVN